MALNPITYTEKVISSFLRYQLTRHPFADANLYQQMRDLLSLDVTRNTPLLKGPYVSLSRSFSEGVAVKTLVDERLFHPHMNNLVSFPTLYEHQEKAAKKAFDEKRDTVVHPPEERCSRDSMREKPPRILITNVKQLELLLTRNKDVELFDGSTLNYLVFEEAHTYSGANGAETACLIRRLRAFCGREIGETTCIATSATIADPKQDRR